ncbi:MAG: superoxide dismutase, Ni [Gammaproteobacteria bacterium]|nr:superoxide dismutase, Ni [Gammaproteobacteria bacterium]
MQKTHKHLFTCLLLVSSLFMLPKMAYAHCQIPCGIYDDHAKVQEMLQEAKTIKRATTFITDLSKKTDAQSQHQTIRWIMNKEEHAQQIITTIADYFLTQRVKEAHKDYADRLKKHHSVMVAAMKAKQNSDVKYADALEKSIQALLPYYPEHKH